ncbi:hypothetical protein AQUCO_01300898v1 [Aquilegia coerulea]|uniref:Uncharacterized protein n=1 Tax=Aquilegia coerulea TaxID=218851 RepID=A0A2G5E4J6_AQUCA|nr:hypothetical protein AQUCO_01300898v1 [Aquilegia coerulea]
MRARLVVFPIKQRNWCFIRSIDRQASKSSSSSSTTNTNTTTSLKDLWKKISSNDKPITQNAEVVVDFFANKMNRAWTGLENAPQGSVKNKIHSVGLFLLSRVKPSEIFLKSISKDITNVEVTYPTSLDPRLVRRRLRHIAMRGTVIHRKYFYGSVTLLPFTSALAVLPLPNVPFFWMLFRTYSHWRALKGSERLLRLVSNCPQDWKSVTTKKKNEEGATHSDIHLKDHKSPGRPWVLQPSEELDRFLDRLNEDDGLSKSVLSDICKAYQLDVNDVMKYKKLM